MREEKIKEVYNFKKKFYLTTEIRIYNLKIESSFKNVNARKLPTKWQGGFLRYCL